MSILFEDPITFSIMVDAHITKCGHTFSKETITEYIKDKSCCPICNKKLTLEELTPNYKLNEAIVKYKEYKDTQGRSFGDVTTDEIIIPREIDIEKLKKEINPKYKSKKERDDYQIIIDIISASGLPSRPKSFIGGNKAISSYCMILFGRSGGGGAGPVKKGRVQRTTTVRGNTNPLWNESFIFEVNSGEDENGDNNLGGSADGNDEILIQLWDERMVGKDVLLGELVLGWNEITRKKNKKVEFDEHFKSSDSPSVKRLKGKRPRSTNSLENLGSVKFTICYVNLKDLKTSSGDEEEEKNNGKGKGKAKAKAKSKKETYGWDKG